MILSDTGLRESLSRKELICEPIEDSQIQPASIDLTLGDEFLVLDEEIVDLWRKAPRYDRVVENEFILYPHGFVLGTTVEVVCIPQHLTAFVEGKSRIGRSGLFIQNAGWIDPGFTGTITLELYNVNSVPMIIRSGETICQLVVSRLDQRASRPYNGRYQGQIGVTGAR